MNFAQPKVGRVQGHISCHSEILSRPRKITKLFPLKSSICEKYTPTECAQYETNLLQS